MMSNEGNICNKYDDVAAAHVKHADESFNVFPDLGGEARRGEELVVVVDVNLPRTAGLPCGRSGSESCRLIANKNGTGAKARRMRRPAEGDGLSVSVIFCHLHLAISRGHCRHCFVE